MDSTQPNFQPHQAASTTSHPFSILLILSNRLSHLTLISSIRQPILD
jgi:hypothetical protein